MSPAVRQVLEIARWEFFRFFKWKDLLVGLLFFVGVSALAGGLGLFLGGSRRDVTLAVVSDLELPSPAPGSRLKLRSAPAAGIDELRAQVGRGELTGLLVVPPEVEAPAELFVKKEPRFATEVTGLVTEVRRRQRLEARNLAPADLEAILAKGAVTVTWHPESKGPKGRAEKVAALLVVILVVALAFTSLAYLLAGITGEKQQRVAELVVAAAPPQAWIDGKILGIAAYSLVNAATLAVGMVVVPLSLSPFVPIAWPSRLGSPAVLAALALVALLGVLMWNCFFAAVAAVINDPNTSSKSSLMFLPILPVVLGLFVIDSPDTTAARVLAIVPLTSPAVFPVRLVLSDPGPLEAIAALAALAAAVLFFRRLAGRVFEVGILMYGKEPTIPEIWRVAFPKKRAGSG